MNENDINLCKEAIISITDIIEKLSNQVIDLENKLMKSENKNKELEKNNIIKQKKTQNIQDTDEYKIRLIRSRRANNY
jgi:hypothetical protein